MCFLSALGQVNGHHQSGMSQFRSVHDQPTFLLIAWRSRCVVAPRMLQWSPVASSSPQTRQGKRTGQDLQTFLAASVFIARMSGLSRFGSTQNRSGSSFRHAPSTIQLVSRGSARVVSDIIFSYGACTCSQAARIHGKHGYGKREKRGGTCLRRSGHDRQRSSPCGRRSSGIAHDPFLAVHAAGSVFLVVIRDNVTAVTPVKARAFLVQFHGQDGMRPAVTPGFTASSAYHLYILT